MNVSIWLTVFGVRPWKSWNTSGPLKSLAALFGSVYWTLIVQNGPCGMLALMSALPDVRVMREDLGVGRAAAVERQGITLLGRHREVRDRGERGQQPAVFQDVQGGTVAASARVAAVDHRAGPEGWRNFTGSSVPGVATPSSTRAGHGTQDIGRLGPALEMAPPGPRRPRIPSQRTPTSRTNNPA